MKLGFYKPTLLKVHPPIREITAHATIGWDIPLYHFASSF